MTDREAIEIIQAIKARPLVNGKMQITPDEFALLRKLSTRFAATMPSNVRTVAVRNGMLD